MGECGANEVGQPVPVCVAVIDDERVIVAVMVEDIVAVDEEVAVEDAVTDAEDVPVFEEEGEEVALDDEVPL